MKLFSVTTVNLIQNSDLHKLKSWVSTDCRTVGIFTEIEIAMECVSYNDGDIHERSWKYAVIEEFEPDQLYPQIIGEMWYEWMGDHDSGGYMFSKKPDELKNVVSFGIG